MLRFFIDMDGTICDTLKKWVKLYNIKVNTGDPMKCDDFVDYRVEENIPKNLRPQFLDLMFTKKFFRDLEPIDGAIDVINKMHGLGAEILFVTKPPYGGNGDMISRANAIRDKILWLQEHFKWFHIEQFVLAPRRDILVDGYLIDDNSNNIKGFAKNGLPILFKQPYNVRDIDQLKSSANALILDSWWNLFGLLKETAEIMLNVYGYVPMPKWRYTDFSGFIFMNQELLEFANKGLVEMEVRVND